MNNPITVTFIEDNSKDYACSGGAEQSAVRCNRLLAVLLSLDKIEKLLDLVLGLYGSLNLVAV